MREIIQNTKSTTDVEVLKRIAQTSVDYYNTMIKSTDAFVDHLRMNKSVYSIDRILVALYEHNTDIQYTSFFKDRKSDILSKFKRKRLMLGKLLQEGDNLTICGNPISLLMMVTGQDYLNEGCFVSREDGIECYTTRFNDGECLAGFRSPHNSPNNIVHLINRYSKSIQTYFPKLGDNIIIINGIGSDVQERMNSQDLDSDSCYVTNQTGDKVTFSSGRYYEASDGSGASGNMYLGKKVKITRINKGSKYPYAIDATDGTELGWVKLNQLKGYASGIMRVPNDQLAWTQEQGEEAIVRNDGSILTPLSRDVSVLNADMTKNLWDFMGNPGSFLSDYSDGEKFGVKNVDNSSSVVNQFDNLTFNLPNVQNTDDFIKEMARNKKFEKMICAMTIGRAMGGSSLAKYNIVR